RLRAVVYHSAAHFNCRMVSSGGDVWFHHGILTKSIPVYEGNLNTLASELHSRDGKDAVMAVYV
ncbi:hypothetical protein B0H14DRAFT_2338179, partial [Mycena olivaceomarginata]